MPYILGNECAGEVVAVGDNVDEKTFGYKVGDMVAVGLLFCWDSCRSRKLSLTKITA